MIRHAVAFTFVLSLVLAGASSAHADTDEAACTLYEIKASKGEGGIDKELAPLAKKLKKPPFSTWKTFKLLKKHTATAVRMKAVTLKLVSGGKVTLLYRDLMESKKRKSKPRLRLSMTLDDKNGKRKLDLTIKLDSGDYHLIGSDADKDGTKILATTCSVK